MTRMTAAEFRESSVKPAKRSKYGNVKTEVDGRTFDSKAEAKFYSILKAREAAGEVFEVELQRPFALAINGRLICTYKADFHFYDAVAKRNRTVDVKGVKTKDFVIKQKLMKAIFGIDVEVVK